MDKDRIEGKMDDAKGRAKRQVVEWTGDEELKGEGAMDQAKGKAKDAFGKGKDAGRDAIDRMKDNADRDDKDRKDEEDVA
jgi:uncharacterized protein YjbJ (UPF0337 family)